MSLKLASNLDLPDDIITEALVAVWPSGMTMDEIALDASYATSSSGFKNGLSKLRTLGLLDGGNKETMYASGIFFDSGDWR